MLDSVHHAKSKKDEWKKKQAAEGATVSKDGETATKDGVTSTKAEDPNAMEVPEVPSDGGVITAADIFKVGLDRTWSPRHQHTLNLSFIESHAALWCGFPVANLWHYPITLAATFAR